MIKNKFTISYFIYLHDFANVLLFQIFQFRGKIKNLINIDILYDLNINNKNYNCNFE